MSYSQFDIQIENFRNKFNLPMSNKPRSLTVDEAALHIKMIKDEFEKELVPALLMGDTVEIYDGAIDMIIYLGGLLKNAGMDIQAGLSEAYNSNMSKLGTDGEPIYAKEGDGSGEPAGKVLKGPNYREPNFRKLLLDQGWEGNLR